MPLNEDLSFDDVRYLISSRSGWKMPHRDPEGFVTGKPRFGSISYDVELSFLERPRKQRLDAGTLLARLDFPVTFGIFMGVWWTRKEVMAQR